ncbi:MAG: HAMP domain-containing sensor histidine kinase [Blastocatellia bacterium]
MQKSPSASLLCDQTGLIVAGDAQLTRLPGLSAATVSGLTLQEISERLNCPGLAQGLHDWLAGGAPEMWLTLEGQFRQARLRRWQAEDGQPLCLIEFTTTSPEVLPTAPDGQPSFPEIGWLTSRLLHDFKNQISGLKLYASYLKKHCAAVSAGSSDGPNDAVEIVEKIIGGLNLMAEHAVLISRLTQPLVLKPAPASLVSLINQLTDEAAGLALAQGIGLTADLPSEPVSLNCDAQMLFTALRALTVRAIAACRREGQVVVTLRRIQNEIQIEIADGSSELLSEAQCAALFELPVNERLNTSVLSLALADRIIRQHGGRTEVTSTRPAGTAVTIRLEAK